jgi:hypothetical protein
MLLLVDRPFSDGQRTASEILGSRISSREFSSAGPAADIVVGEDLDVSGVGMEGAPPEWHGYFQDGSSEPTHWSLRNKLARHYELDPKPYSH